MKKGLLQKLGGRKFLLTLLAIAVGTAIELLTERGLTAAFAGLMGTLIAAFGLANAGIERAHVKSNEGKKDDDALKQVRSEVSKLLSLAQEMNNEENTQKFVDLLTEIRDTSSITAQTAGNALQSTEQTRKMIATALGTKGASNEGQRGN